MISKILIGGKYKECVTLDPSETMSAWRTLTAPIPVDWDESLIAVYTSYFSANSEIVSSAINDLINDEATCELLRKCSARKSSNTAVDLEAILGA